jgi:hypothetical protein
MSSQTDDVKRGETMEVTSTKTFTAPYETTDEKEIHSC